MGGRLLDQHKSSGGSPELAIIDFLVLIYPAKIPENIPELEFEKYTLQKSTEVYSIFQTLNQGYEQGILQCITALKSLHTRSDRPKKSKFVSPTLPPGNLRGSKSL